MLVPMDSTNVPKTVTTHLDHTHAAVTLATISTATAEHAVVRDNNSNPLLSVQHEF